MHRTRFQLSSSTLVIAAALLASGAAQAQTAPAPANSQPPAAGSQPKPPEARPDVIVRGTRPDVISGPDRVSFNVANDLQVQTGTVADALRAVPGVEVDLQGNVSLRGDAGVTILVDGRPSAMLSGDSRGDVLLSMPAGRLERVEVITNPSAAMSPEGSAGAINLVTRRAGPGGRAAAGAGSPSGTVRLTAGGEGRRMIGLNGTHSRGRLTLSSEFGYRRFTGDSSAEQARSRLAPGSGEFIDSGQETDIDNKARARMARFAGDYDINEDNRISTELGYRNIGVDVDRTDAFASEIAGASYDRASDISLANRGLSARGSWRRSLPGDDHELTADLEVEKGRFRRQVEAVTSFADGADYERIGNAGDRRDYTAKLDYKRPIGESGSLNLGYQGNLLRTEFDFSGARGPSFDELVPVAGLTNSFDYDQKVHALFGTYRFEVGKLETQAGLRLEQADTTIDQITDAIRVENDYLRAYPTLHLGYELTEQQQLRASYSRRIQRPSPQELNPYTIYIDPLNLRRGNPFLRPEVTDSFELGWQTRKAGTFYSLTGFYRRSRGGVTDVIRDIGDGVFLTTRENLATAKRIGAELVANGKLGKTLSYNASGTVMWSEIDPRVSGFSDPTSGRTATGRANLSWQPTPRDFLQVNAIYGGKQLVPQGYRLSRGILNLGYRRKVSDRFSLLLTAQDVLETARQVIVFRTPTLRDRIEQTGPGRMLLFGLTYNLGGQSSRQKEPNFDFQQAPGDSVQ